MSDIVLSRPSDYSNNYCTLCGCSGLTDDGIIYRTETGRNTFVCKKCKAALKEKIDG